MNKLVKLTDLKAHFQRWHDNYGWGFFRLWNS